MMNSSSLKGRRRLKSSREKKPRIPVKPQKMGTLWVSLRSLSWTSWTCCHALEKFLVFVLNEVESIHTEKCIWQSRFCSFNLRGYTGNSRNRSKQPWWAHKWVVHLTYRLFTVYSSSLILSEHPVLWQTLHSSERLYHWPLRSQDLIPLPGKVSWNRISV